MERWGALSVKDHIDRRALATEVLLYDKLVIPAPPDWDVHRWETNGWDPKGLERRLKKLGGLAYRANWGQKEQEDWAQDFSALVADAEQVGLAPTEAAAMQLTKLRLAQDEVVKQGDGVVPEVVAAFRSEGKFYQAISSETTVQVPPQPLPAFESASSRIDAIVGVRLVVPHDDDQDKELAAAIHIAKDSTFRERRETVHAWQRWKLDQWGKKSAITEKEIQAAGKELDDLIKRYNEKAQKVAKKRRIETAIMVASLGTGAIGLAAGFYPWLVASAAVGGLAGSQTIQVGMFGVSGLLQCIKHHLSKSEPDAAARVPAVGAMFHQLESHKRWQERQTTRFPFFMF